MLTFRPARNDQEYEGLLELIYHQRTAYLDPVLDLVELTLEQFGAYFRATGVVYRICLRGELAGLCWVKVSKQTLTVLGLIVRDECQGMGIGTAALAWVERRYCMRVRAIELDVHVSNTRARALYQRLGYQVSNSNKPGGFIEMRKLLDKDQVFALPALPHNRGGFYAPIFR